MNETERIAANKFITRYIESKIAMDEWDPTPVGLMRIAFGEAVSQKNEELKSIVRDMQTILKDLRWARLNQNHDIGPIIEKLAFYLSNHPDYLVEI